MCVYVLLGLCSLLCVLCVVLVSLHTCLPLLPLTHLHTHLHLQTHTHTCTHAASLSLLPVNPRELYVPPQRAYETGPHGQGDHRPASADMAHLSPPRPASADTLVASQRMLGSFGEWFCGLVR